VVIRNFPDAAGNNLWTSNGNARVYHSLACILESEILMENRNRSDGSVGSDVGIGNAEIYLVTANIL